MAGDINSLNLLVCPEKIVSFLCRMHIFKRTFRQDIFMEANNMTPDQTAPKGAV